MDFTTGMQDTSWYHGIEWRSIDSRFEDDIAARFVLVAERFDLFAEKKLADLLSNFEWQVEEIRISE